MKLFNTLILALFLLNTSIQANAGSKIGLCETLFYSSTSFNPAQLELALKVDLKGLTTDAKIIKSLLDSIPDVLKRPEPPQGEELKKTLEQISEDDAKKYFGESYFSVMYKGVQIEDQILDLIKNNFIFNGDYFFIGNGMNSFYQIVTKIFEDSKVEKSIRKLKISRNFLDTDERSVKQAKKDLFKYFKKLGFDKYGNRKIILIDSITQHNGNNHSLFKAAEYLVEFLEKNGLTKLEALNKVVTVAIPEEGSIHDKFVIDSSDAIQKEDLLDSYNLQYSRLKNPDGHITRPTLSDNSLGNTNLKFAYSEVKKWQTFGSKYSLYDPVKGEPVPQIDDLPYLINNPQSQLRNYQNIFNNRLAYLYFLKLVDVYYSQIKETTAYKSVIDNSVDEMMQ